MLNNVTLIGNLGADPEVRYMPNGGAVVSISLATTRNWKNKETGEKQSETEWHRVTMFAKLAEIAGQYLKKGSKVYVTGRLKTQKWTKDGVDHYTTGIISNEMIMLDSKPSDNQHPAAAQTNKPVSHAYSMPTQKNSTMPPPPPDYENFDDDSIPF